MGPTNYPTETIVGQPHINEEIREDPYALRLKCHSLMMRLQVYTKSIPDPFSRIRKSLIFLGQVPLQKRKDLLGANQLTPLFVQFLKKPVTVSSVAIWERVCRPERHNLRPLLPAGLGVQHMSLLALDHLIQNC